MTDTKTLTLTDFLLARIAEDEAAAERGRSHPDPATFANDNYGYLWVQPERVLAECEAKRRIVEIHEEAVRYVSIGRPEIEQIGCETCCAGWSDADWDGPRPVLWPCPTLRALAAVYADHEDYREEWAA